MDLDAITFRRIVPPAAIAATFMLLFVAERVRPLRSPKRGLRRRLWTNAWTSAGAFVAGRLAVVPAALALARWNQESGVGLLARVSLPFPVAMLVGVVLMDLTFYWWHRANHRVGLLWRFHCAHHVDPDLDTTTSFRFHPGEVLYSTAFRAAQVAVLGVGPMTYVVFETVFQCGTVFHHSNVRLPVRLERWLNKIVVTPRMHGVHHSTVRHETDSNYSVIFSWWDRLSRTIRLNVPQDAVTIGVPAYLEPDDNRVRSVLAMPLQRQRRYWRRTERVRTSRAEEETEGPPSRMAP